MKMFLDSSVILAFLAGQDGKAYTIIKSITKGTYEGYINGIVISEVIYGYLRLATGLGSKRIRQWLARKEKRECSI